jgi:hypothetical protein
MKEKKARVEDALNATRAAVEEGIVPGGGVALLRAAKGIETATLEGDEKVGANIVRRALEEPIRQIVENAGLEGSVVVEKVKADNRPTWGYDAESMQFVDMMQAGIIDPTKVERVALQNSAAAASLFLLTEAVVVDVRPGEPGSVRTRASLEQRLGATRRRVSGLGPLAVGTRSLAPVLPLNARPAPPTVVRRTAHVEVVGRLPLRPGDAFTARVLADTFTAIEWEEAREIARGIRGSVSAIHFKVWIAATSHFTFPGRRVQPFTIDMADPDRVPTCDFDIRVGDDITDGRDARLEANFTFDGRPAGKVSVQVPLDTPRGGGPQDRDAALASTSPGGPLADLAARRPDLTIHIADPRRTRRYLQCLLESPHLPAAETGDAFDWVLPSDTGDLVKSYMAQFVSAGTEDDGSHNGQGRLWSLRGAGRSLWEMTHERMQEVFWKLLDRGKLETILIVSEEPYIPWELMMPVRGQERRRPLGVEFLVGRWLTREFLPPVQDVPLSRSLIVAPDYTAAPKYPGTRPKPLDHAGPEVAAVLGTIPGERLKPATATRLVARLATSPADLLHFVCHGAAEDTLGVQVIYLEDKKLTSLQVKGMDELEDAFKRRPLLFLNACEVGRPVPALVGLGGFAQAFLELGASVVVAPLWSVKDSVAAVVARTFYEALRRQPPPPLASILRDVRAKAYETGTETEGEDTYAAYCFYGDPFAVANIRP